MDNDTQTFSNMHFYTLMGGLNPLRLPPLQAMAMIKQTLWTVGFFYWCFLKSFEDDLQKEPGSGSGFAEDTTTQDSNISTTISLAAALPSCLAWAHMPSFSSIHRHLLVCVNLTQTAWNGDSRLMTGDHTKEETLLSRCICGKQRKKIIKPVIRHVNHAPWHHIQSIQQVKNENVWLSYNVFRAVSNSIVHSTDTNQRQTLSSNPIRAKGYIQQKRLLIVLCFHRQVGWKVKSFQSDP